KSTSRLLPAACDEFLFYDRLEGVEGPEESERAPRTRRGRPTGSSAAGREGGQERSGAPMPEPAGAAGPQDAEDEESAGAAEPVSLDVLVAQTLAGLQTSSSSAITASVLKRTLLRKDPTFSESDRGFRSFGEVLRHLAERGIVELDTGPAAGDPVVSLPEQGEREDAFDLLRTVVRDADGRVVLSGLKNRLRKHRPDFSEKTLGYRGFLQFVKAADAAGVVQLRWDEDAEDYLLSV